MEPTPGYPTELRRTAHGHHPTGLPPAGGPASVRRVLARLLAAILAAGALGVVAASPAQAAPSGWKCYSTYAQDCVGQFGYDGQSVWGYPVDAWGNNCTNYVALRLKQNGAKKEERLGNAIAWDESARARGYKVDGKPSVGAVAQWNYGDYGHVAYVDWVSSDGNQVAVSETGYHLSARIPSMSGRSVLNKRGGGSSGPSAYMGWPDNFIHFKDLPTGTKPKFTASAPASIVVGWTSVSYKFSASGKPAPKFSVASGSLPTGMKLASNGTLSGTPRVPGTYKFKVRAKNSAGQVDSPTRTMVVVADPSDFDADTDVNGDGRPDIVGFGTAAVYVALNTGTGFAKPTEWLDTFVYDTGWRVEKHPRTLTDVNGDGRPDIVGFGTAAVYVSLNTGTGFAKPTQWLDTFGYDKGWRVEKHVRTVTDVNGDGRPDIVGFGTAAVYVSLNTGTGFAKPTQWLDTFVYDTGWRVEKHPRTLTDVNGDGRPDIVGFGTAAVYVSLNTGSGFAKPAKWLDTFGYDKGWRVEKHPRTLTDVNGDGRPDIVGFGTAAVYVALNTGTGFAKPTKWLDTFVYDTGWRVEKHVRTLTDVNGDSRPDIVGFGEAAVYVSLNTGTGFAKPTRWLDTFGYDTGWRVERHPRLVG